MGLTNADTNSLRYLNLNIKQAFLFHNTNSQPALLDPQQFKEYICQQSTQFSESLRQIPLEVPSQNESQQQKVDSVKISQDIDYCFRSECREREAIIEEQQKKIEELEGMLEKMELKLMGKKGKIGLLKLQVKILEAQSKNDQPQSKLRLIVPHQKSDEQKKKHNSLDANETPSIDKPKHIVPPLKLQDHSQALTARTNHSRESSSDFFKPLYPGTTRQGTAPPQLDANYFFLQDEDHRIEHGSVDDGGNFAEPSSDYFMEMESPRRAKRGQQQHSSIYSSIANFKGNQQMRQQEMEHPPVYLEGLDVFDEYEQRFNDFLRSTPYIDQILQTSKEYRLVIESLNILARFNDELKRICTMARKYQQEGRKLQLSKTKCEDINRKNRELRVQIKSMLKDSVSSVSSGKGMEKASQSKRDLIKQRNYLMEENDTLLFHFKKSFLF